MGRRPKEKNGQSVEVISHLKLKEDANMMLSCVQPKSNFHATKDVL
jgi:hypothetical protein